MELLITRPIEDRIRTIPGVRRVSSTSVEGISQVTAEFEWGIRLTDARQLVQSELSSVQSGLPAVSFVVFKQPNASTIKVVRGIDREMKQVRTLLPAGVQVRKFYDQSDIVAEARDSLFHDLIAGAMLAAAVLFFFMGTLRATLIVTASIPITLLATLAMMQAFGQTLNVITLSALTLAVGMVVDDAIVVAENVMRHLQAKGDRLSASLAGAAEIAGPDASGTFTTVAAYAPLLFIGGLAAWLGPISVLPPIDEGAILIEYITPPGTGLRESDRIGDILERLALSQNDVETVYRRTGSPERGFQIEGVNGSIPAAVSRLRQKFSVLPLPAGYSIAFTGQYQAMQRTIVDFALVGLAAVMLIYLIMAMQFRSFLQPLIILVTIPVALVGAIVLLAVTQVGLDVSVGMGALTLIGIAVNNAIVLLDYTNRQVSDGHKISDSLLAAVSIRLRPILMTAITTIFALIPVAVNPAVGSRIFQPFAITVIGGLISSTAATLVLVPVLRIFLSRQWQ